MFDPPIDDAPPGLTLRNMDRDLTPAEARAEVETFVGEGWECGACELPVFVDLPDKPHVTASRGDVNLCCDAPTYRAAVAALKSAWRDAVRPWVTAAVDEARDSLTIVGDAYEEWDMTRVETVARVLGEDK